MIHRHGICAVLLLAMGAMLIYILSSREFDDVAYSETIDMSQLVFMPCGDPMPDTMFIGLNGKDGNLCTMACPCKTIGYARAITEGGTENTIYLFDGAYRGKREYTP